MQHETVWAVVRSRKLRHGRNQHNWSQWHSSDCTVLLSSWTEPMVHIMQGWLPWTLNPKDRTLEDFWTLRNQANIVGSSSSGKCTLASPHIAVLEKQCAKLSHSTPPSTSAMSGFMIPTSFQPPIPALSNACHYTYMHQGKPLKDWSSQSLLHRILRIGPVTQVTMDNQTLSVIRRHSRVMWTFGRINLIATTSSFPTCWSWTKLIWSAWQQPILWDPKFHKSWRCSFPWCLLLARSCQEPQVVQHLQSLIQQRHQKASLPPPPNLYYAPCTCIITFMTTAVQNQNHYFVHNLL